MADHDEAVARAAVAEGAPADEHAVDYSIYIKSWLALLIITVVMVLWHPLFVVIVGMSIKAMIIALWFMHLRYEKLDFVLCILLGIFATAAVLYGLIAPDGVMMGLHK